MADYSPLELPAPPAELTGEVKAWCEPIVLYTYETAPPQKNPMFLENRVYQGSSGRVYPLPCIERVAQQGEQRTWRAAHIENEYLRLMILPDLGGRIHVGLDKTNGYDFFYRQNVIKPALVGLTGPWISGGVEFNWPQHHRPATYMPVEVTIEANEDGSMTIWCSDHDPLERLKGAHGICLYPGKAYVELKVRLYNRTALTQTFLWWANVAVRVNENYQSFFPPDVHFVADHAKRAVTTYPLSESTYYGIDYAARAKRGIPANEMPARFQPRSDIAPNDLTWYSNIPVPTSYMAIGSRGDFFGGYDHGRHAGFVHVANRHIAPGKKQWTWGNSEFGYAWERNLTDSDGPYIELMAGVYTDNQPDFSFLAPGERKTFRQYWFPIQQIGIPQKANQQAALRFTFGSGFGNLALCVTEERRDATVSLFRRVADIWEQIATQPVRARPGAPVKLSFDLPHGVMEDELQVQVRDANGEEIISYAPGEFSRNGLLLPEPATETAVPEEIASSDELFLTGLHLAQYRHATWSPEPYWREVLKRDPGDSRTHDALGVWHLRRGEFEEAEQHFRAAISRLTIRNPNPASGEAFYHLGLALRFLARDEEAYDTFYKSVWNFATRSCGYQALAELDAKAGRWQAALDHLRRSLATNAENTNARNLAAVVLRLLGREQEAAAWIDNTLRQDPTDSWACYLKDGKAPEDSQILLDLAFDYARAGLYPEASLILATADRDWDGGTAPIRGYALASFYDAQRQTLQAASWRNNAQQAAPEYCFPNRLEELLILQSAIAKSPNDAKARYYLGNFLYDRRRYDQAIETWEASVALDEHFATVLRNLGIAYFNVRDDAAKAFRAFDKAFALDQTDARVFYERDQLWKRTGAAPQERLAEFEANRELVQERDDLSVEFASLYQQTGRYHEALSVLCSRLFQPWEGGEGLAVAQHVRTHVALGRRAIEQGDASSAKKYFEAALSSPANLGEAKHLLVNHAHVYYWLGVASQALKEPEEAQHWWNQAVSGSGDFQEMSVRKFSEMTYYRALAFEKLGHSREAENLLQDLLEYVQQLAQSEPKIDYFATSLPTMLLFKEDLHRKNQLTSALLAAQALVGLGDREVGIERLRWILQMDPNHATAADFLAETEMLKREAPCTGQL